MLEYLFGSVNKERVLRYLFIRKVGYAREIAAYFETDVTPIQNQLNKLEIGNILNSKLSGKTKLFSINPRYPFYKELNQLLEKSIEFLPKEEKEKLTKYRTRPRRSRKPL
jgi:hypothetical protein